MLKAINMVEQKKSMNERTVQDVLTKKNVLRNPERIGQ